MNAMIEKIEIIPLRELNYRFYLGSDGHIYNKKTGFKTKRQPGTGVNIIKLDGKVIRFNVLKCIVKYFFNSSPTRYFAYPKDGNFNNLSKENVFITKVKLRNAQNLINSENVKKIKGTDGYFIKSSGSIYRMYNGKSWLRKCNSFKKNKYWCVYINKKTYYLHRMIGLSFFAENVPERYDRFINIKHGCEGIINNSLKNLYTSVLDIPISEIDHKITKVSESKFSGKFYLDKNVFHTGICDSKDELVKRIEGMFKKEIEKMLK